LALNVSATKLTVDAIAASIGTKVGLGQPQHVVGESRRSRW
jgi:hypothetical protein